MNKELVVNEFYDTDTGTFSYLLADLNSQECLAVDPVLAYDMISGRTSMARVSPLIDTIRSNGWSLKWILETHAHADHLTAAQQLKQAFGAKIAIGRGIVDIQAQFKAIYGFGDSFDTNGSAFDVLLSEGDELEFGDFPIRVLATPGHTRDSLTYRIGNYLFIGDTLFHPDTGTGRCDFPGGDAGLLFESIEKILAQGDDCLICLCHDYPGDRREPETYIPVPRMRENVHLLQAEQQADKFKTIRQQRDAGLALPKLIIPSIQVNCQAGLDLKNPPHALVWPINQF